MIAKLLVFLKNIISKFNISKYLSHTPKIKKRLFNFYLKLKLLSTSGKIHKKVLNIEAVFKLSDISELRRLENFKDEKHVLRKFLSDVKSDYNVWDVGANIGMYSVFVSKKLNNGELICFEPHPKISSRLKENLTLNATEKNWKVSNYALSDRSGQTKLQVVGSGLGNGKHFLNSDEGVSIKQVRADELVKNGFDKPDMLKIDVEGAELKVLRGLDSILDSVKILYIEVHPSNMEKFGNEPKELENFLSSHNFKINNIDADRDNFYFKAER